MPPQNDFLSQMRTRSQNTTSNQSTTTIQPNSNSSSNQQGLVMGAGGNVSAPNMPQSSPVADVSMS